MTAGIMPANILEGTLDETGQNSCCCARLVGPAHGFRTDSGAGRYGCDREDQGGAKDFAGDGDGNGHHEYLWRASYEFRQRESRRRIHAKKACRMEAHGGAAPDVQLRQWLDERPV